MICKASEALALQFFNAFHICNLTPPQNQRFMMCNARFSTLSAASLTASLSVG